MSKLNDHWNDSYDQLFKEIETHAKEWNEKKLCECVKNNQSNEIIVCEHIIKDREMKFSKRIRKLFESGQFISNLEVPLTTRGESKSKKNQNR